MNQTEESDLLAGKRPHRKSWRIVYYFLALCGVLLMAGMFIPVLDGPHKRQYVNEAVSVGKLRTLNELQAKYSAANPRKGFACELAILRSTPPQEDAS